MYSKINKSNTPRLRVHVDSSVPGLVDLYQTAAEKHNNKLKVCGMGDQCGLFPDVGFSLFVPYTTTFSKGCSDQSDYLLNFHVKTELIASVYSGSGSVFNRNMAFLLYPRYNMNKMPLYLANQFAVLADEYDGYLMGIFSCLSHRPFEVEAGIRLVEICLPSRIPFQVELVVDNSVGY
jgi:dUTPase